jgi:hypothetical protein
MNRKWYETSRRRNLVDMHIDDWDKKFLSEFDSKSYVDMVASSNVRSVMIYANSHIGHCYWPTKIGHVHEGIEGRDIFGEMVGLLHGRGLDAIVYFSLIFDNWAGRIHPEWRVLRADGQYGYGLVSKRYIVCCPNTGYRDYVVAQLQDICDSYDFEGVWPDMTFWTDVCYCDSCRTRYRAETGREIPEVLDWNNPEWLRFQRKREEWLADFAWLVTDTIKRKKPDVTVTHQAAAFLWDWRMGASLTMARASDFMAADLYGNSLQQSYFLKLFNSMSEQHPVEYLTSRCPNLRYHTTMKSKDMLECQAFAALAHNAAYLFIDAIDPVGTLNPEVYATMRDLMGKIEECENHLGGSTVQDVAIYHSLESMIYMSDNGKNIKDVHTAHEGSRSTRIPEHVASNLEIEAELLRQHIPHGVISRKNLSELAQFKVIILANSIVMDQEEIDALTAYVREGGKLLVIKNSSLISGSTGGCKDFMLADLMGVSWVGETKEAITYMAPVSGEEGTFKPYTNRSPLALSGTQVLVKKSRNARTIATLILPYTDPGDTDKFASIHSNPPGIATEYPAVVLNEYGKGAVLYVAGTIDLQYNGQIVMNLLKRLSPDAYSVQTNAPGAVELVMYEQKEKQRSMVHLVNFQKDLPNIPVDGIIVRFPIAGRRAKSARTLPDNQILPFSIEGDMLQVTAPRLNNYLLLAIQWE